MKNWLVTIITKEGETLKFEVGTQGGPKRDVLNEFKSDYPGAKITAKQV